MTVHSLCIGLCCFIGIVTNCYSQADAGGIIAVKDLQLSEKLSSNNIRKLLKDPYGFTWIATQDGISRFDGKEIEIIKNNSSYFGALLELDVRDLILDTLNKLIWIVQPGSLSAINYQNLKIAVSVPLTYFEADDWNMKGLLLNNQLWITSYYGLKKFDIKSKKCELIFKSEIKDKDAAVQVNQIYKNSENTIWSVFNQNIIYIINSNTGKITDTLKLTDLGTAAIKKRQILSLHFSKSKAIIAGTDSGLYIMQYRTGKKEYTSESEKINAVIGAVPVLEIASFNDDYYIVVTKKKIFQISYYTNQVVTSYSFSQKDIDKWMSTFSDLILIEKNEFLLSASGGVGIIKLGQSLFNAFNLNETVSDKAHVNCVLPVLGGVLTGTKSGLYLISNQTKEKVTLEAADYYYHCLSAPSGKVLVSGQNRLYCYYNGKLSGAGNEFPELKKYEKVSIISSAKIGDSVLILASENGNGLLLWNYKRKRVAVINKKTKPLAVNTDLINRVFVTNNKQILVLSDYSINLIDEKITAAKEITILNPASQKPYGICFDIAEDASFYWLAVYGTGIVKLTKDFKVVREFGIHDNLYNTGVYKVFDKDSVLWLTTNNGLSVLDKRTGKFKNYFKSDGLHSSAFEEGCGLLYQNMIIAGGDGGFSVIQPQYYATKSVLPGVLINGYTLNYTDKTKDTFSLQSSTIVFDANAQQLVLRLAIPVYADQERIRYYYRIKGLQDQWTINPSHNIISLYKAALGTYQLELKATIDGYEFSTPSIYTLFFKPKWYQTWWFYAAIVLLTAGILYALYRYRIAQIKKQHQIRKNIATDLHDDLGSTLNSVKVFTNLAISGVKQEESLQQVKDNLTEATMSLRDMIWVLDDSLDTVDELVTRLKQFAIPVATASNIETIITAGSDVNSRTLTKEEKRNLFLICKEAINNSIKYSGATQIKIDILPAGKKIQITVTDNGKGFDEATVKKGYGLKNMQYRAGQVKFKIELSSAYGQGTALAIIPC